MSKCWDFFLVILDIRDRSPTTTIVKEFFWVLHAPFLSICQVSLWKWILHWAALCFLLGNYSVAVECPGEGPEIDLFKVNRVNFLSMQRFRYLYKCILATIRGLLCTNLKADWPSCIKSKHGQYLWREEYQELDLFRPLSAHKNEQIVKKDSKWVNILAISFENRTNYDEKVFLPPPPQFPIWIGSQTKGKSQPASFPLVYIQVQSPPRPNSWLTSSSSP